MFVLNFTSPRAWGCNRRIIEDLYSEHSTPVHAEVGVGSGHFLRGINPRTWETLALIDPNPVTLDYVARRLHSHSVERYQADIMNLSPPPKRFTSVAANYLLHCLPGPMSAKEPAIRNLASLTSENGTLFGATVLGESAPHNTLGRALLWACNSAGAFGNIGDTEQCLREILEEYFHSVSIRRVNRVAIFVATTPRRSTLPILDLRKRGRQRRGRQ